MALFTEQELLSRFQRERRLNSRCFSATDIINEGRVTPDTSKTYDIFLSHSSRDNDLIAGLKLILQDLGYTVYVDWSDPNLNPQDVSPQTAAVLRQRMAQCKSLIYAFSENASNSKWMPWELGYFDALKSKVAVLPISQTTKYSFRGSEFVGLYYVIQIDKTEISLKNAIWVHDGDNYVNYEYWLRGEQPYKH